ncbi:hypothetical protein VitviT2T_022461 [Vitis vinifera]|uniref:Protein farnesyltransferase subunit beta n=2 Tax=Vitis vinifera TaxID=29760 RepID=A0ABY9D9V5_VITVI|nr:protein farnesyltransferase subunit beta isoform X1 [Vitis vinifera]WKA04420.1 hypothetical protein VitviT2T_022461 [Vitis vinifera]|eukprot:XP_002278403.1 PREDICTED: protein farnesyltransferase subunit beta [Vitis vinifera]
MDSSETQSPTVTQREQWMVESQVFQMYELLSSVPRNAQSVLLELQRDKHIEFLTNGLRQLGPSFCVLDANRPWLCYWILHSIALLGDSVDDELENNTIDFLSRCQDPNGGYGGGPGQMPHLATTYAAINALITLGGHRSLSSINRGKVYTFLRRMKDPSGAFRMHDAGEMDVRACYTAISVASVLTILDDELVKGVGNFILSCQTYEGGISGEPGSEAHGGYTFCGLATMVLIGEVNRLDLTSLIDWVVFRQGVEGGFQGRTNKLVDGCYSFWQGGVFALIQKLHSIIEEQLRLLDAGGSAIDSPQLASISCHSGKRGLHDTSGSAKFSNIGFNFLKEPAEMEPLFHSIALQQYIILCSQLQEGGFRDKPGKHRDYYHTCYCLSGLSVAQYSYSKDADSPPLPRAVFGPYSNLLEPIHPLYNVILDLYHEAHEFFSTS